MTPPSHMLIGFGIAHLYYAIQHFYNRNIFSLPGLLLVCGCFAVLPDIDSFFGNYTSVDPVIGHRGITHSLPGIIIFVTAGLIIYYSVLRICRSARRKTRLTKMGLIMFLAGLSHLLADLPQPPGIWQGIPVLFPLKINNEYYRVGGWSMIGWYDLKIIVNFLYAFFLSLFFVTIYKIVSSKNFKQGSKIFIVMVAVINIYVFGWLIGYIYTSPYSTQAGWSDYQKRIVAELPEPLKGSIKKGTVFFTKFFRSVTK